jgi:hypothetical protein
MPFLYKYLPSEYARAFLDKGEVLFRKLTYFIKQEDKVRGDPWEGTHRNVSQNDCAINLGDRKRIVGEFSVLNSINNADLVYIFCLSELNSENLMNEFKSDACIEIFDPDEFIRRIRFAIMRKPWNDRKIGLIDKSVHYYRADSSECSFDITDPKQLAFAKERSYAWQKEFMLVFSVGKALKKLKNA